MFGILIPTVLRVDLTFVLRSSLLESGHENPIHLWLEAFKNCAKKGPKGIASYSEEATPDNVFKVIFCYTVMIWEPDCQIQTISHPDSVLCLVFECSTKSRDLDNHLNSGLVFKWLVSLTPPDSDDHLNSGPVLKWLVKPFEKRAKTRYVIYWWPLR